MRSVSQSAVLLVSAVLPAQAPGLGAPAPPLEVAALGGRGPIPKQAVPVRGRLVIFWRGGAVGPWLADVERLLARHPRGAIELVTVAVGGPRRSAAGRRDAYDATGAAWDAWIRAAGTDDRGKRRAPAAPTCVLVDRDGRIAWIGSPSPLLAEPLAAVIDGSYDIEFERLCRRYEPEIRRAWAGGDARTMARLSDELIAANPSGSRPWMLKLIAFATVAADPARADRVARTGLAALTPHAAELAKFARRWLRTVREISPDSLEFAAKRLRRAVESAPELAEAGTALVEVLDRLGRTEEAAAAAGKVAACLAERPVELERLAFDLSEFTRHPAAYAAVAVAARRAVAEAEPTAYRLRLWFDDEVAARNDAQADLVGDRLVQIVAADAEALNDLGWTLLTEIPYAGRFEKLALRIADRLAALPDGDTYYMLDTRALAKFENGSIDEAIALQRRALLRGGAGDEEYEARLRRYRAARRDR